MHLMSKAKVKAQYCCCNTFGGSDTTIFIFIAVGIFKNSMHKYYILLNFKIDLNLTGIIIQTMQSYYESPFLYMLLLKVLRFCLSVDISLTAI